MSQRIFVGNLPYSTGEAELRELFEEHGDVASVHVVTDRETGRPRGFAFVEMETGGDEAIEALDGTEHGGRTLNVNVARPRPPRRQFG